MAINKGIVDLAINGGILLALAGGAYFVYTNNMFGIRNLIGGLSGDISSIGQQGSMQYPIMPGTPAGYPTPQSGGYPTAPLPSQLPNPVGFEQGFTPGGTGPIPGGAPGINYNQAIYDSPFGTPAIDPITGIDYSLYYPPTGVGTLPGTNPAPYPNPCLPGHYRASDQKCYPIPTQFPGNGCGNGMYLANDGRCYPYPTGAGGVGAGNMPVPCPLGEYRASDGKCYALPTPPPESCPTGAYRASDGKCYPITPGQPVGDCPTGYTMGSDGICRASTACPTGHTMTNGVCVPTTNPCPTGYNLVNGVCTPSATTCPTGYHLVNNICVPDTTPCPAGTILVNGVCVPPGPGSPLNIPLGPLMLVKILPPGVSPGQYCQSCLYRDEMGHIDTTFWAAVMLRPELSGGVPQFAVIIRAEDPGDFRDAMARQGFQPLTPDILSRYIPAPGSFAAFAGSVDVMQTYNKRILNRYR